jgi:hypothetical protein
MSQLRHAPTLALVLARLSHLSDRRFAMPEPVDCTRERSGEGKRPRQRKLDETESSKRKGMK